MVKIVDQCFFLESLHPNPHLQFKCNFHNVVIFPHATTGNKKSVLPFYITKRDIIEEVKKWPAKYQPPLS